MYLDRKIGSGGWVRSDRGSKSFGFLTISGGSLFEPPWIVYHDSPSSLQTVQKINVDAALIIRGTLTATPDAKRLFETQVSEIPVEGDSVPDYPLQKKCHLLELLRTILHLRLHTNLFQAASCVRSVITFVIHRFSRERNLVYVHTLLITSSDTEDAGETFHMTTLDPNDIPRTPDGLVDYHAGFLGKEIDLMASGQLDGEASAQAFHGIYIFGLVSCAENSNTIHHAAEFWMIEPEISFTDLNDAMAPTEGMLKYITRCVLEHTPEEMEFLNRLVGTGLLKRLNHVLNPEFGRTSYVGAVDILMQHNDSFDYKTSRGTDLQTEHGRFLIKRVLKHPLLVTGYPRDIKALYMKLNSDDKAVAAIDCLVPGINEIIGDSQCEDNYDKLLARIQEPHMDERGYRFCLDLRKYGSSRHVGYSLGFECCIMYLIGIQSIRDALPFPRTVGNYEL